MRLRFVWTTALALGLAAAAPVRADGPLDQLRDAWAQWRAEVEIEGRMALGHVRGLLEKKPAPPDWTPRAWGEGRLERGPGGVPILYLEGTPEEMGAQHGHLLRGEIQALTQYVRQFVGRRELEAARARARRLFAEATPPRYLAEAEAMAAAAGVPTEDLLFAQWFTDLYRAFACSTVSAPSPEGRFLARNLDFPGMGYLGRYSLVVVARPEGRRPFVSITWPGLIGVLSGQNDALALSVMVVHGDDGARPGVPFQLAFRQVLEETGSVAEAQALLERTPLTVTNNLMVVDAAGASAVLELHPDGLAARAAEADDRLVSTNHFLTRALREPRFSLGYLNSRRRFRSAAACGPAEGSWTLEEAREALRASAMPITQQSMVFLPAHGALEVAFTDGGAAAERPFVRLERRWLLGD